MDAGLRAFGAEAVDVDVDELAQLADQELDVHPGPAVDVGRVLARQDRHSHRSTVATSAATSVG